MLSNLYGTLIWSFNGIFFATSHDKGVVDGAWGNSEMIRVEASRSGIVHVNTPEEYAKVAETCNPHIKCISKTFIEAGEQHLNAE